MGGALVQVEREAGVATLTLHDPERRNAMTRALGEAFAARVAELREDASVRALVLTGAGRAFSAGGDLAMLEALAARGADGADAARAEIRDTMRSFYDLFLSVRDLACPTIAAINGPAIGAGLCVALACDLRLAARGARLALNFTRLAIHPGMGATWTLPRLVGPAVAAELLFTSRSLDAEEAEGVGLVNRCVEPEELLPCARELAAEIAANGPLAVRGTRRALAGALDRTLGEQLDFEAQEQADCLGSRDVREGLAAVRERRDPKFAGS